MTTDPKYMITEVDVTAGTHSTREMTQAEKDDLDARAAAWAEQQAAEAAAAEAKAAAKASAAAKLAKLGLTEEEIAAIQG